MADINVGQLSEAINGKMDRDGNNIASPKLPVFLVAVQYPTAENNYTWYRKYSDGWIEQGGQITTTTTAASAAGNTTITFPQEFANTSYYFNMAGYISNSSETVRILQFGITSKTTTTIKGNAAYISSGGESYRANAATWQAVGMAAQ